MSTSIDLKAYTKKTRRLNYSAGDIFRKVKQGKDMDRIIQSWGLVTSGIVETTHIGGGLAWSLSDYVEFSYVYTTRPIFSWGIDGTAGLETGGWSAGDNVYSGELPATLSLLTAETYQPAMYIPRIIHWHIEDYMYLGCYFLVCQLNPECTETDKTIRIHYTFTGDGFVHT